MSETSNYLRPSNMYRASHCPYSFLESNELYEGTSVYAEKGVQSHALLEQLYKNKGDIKKIDSTFYPALNDTAQKAVYKQYVQLLGHIKGLMPDGKYGYCTELLCEIKDKETNDVVLKGTLDFVFMNRHQKCIYIIDYKSGIGDTRVSGFFQLLTYKMLLQNMSFYNNNYAGYDIKTYIFQPLWRDPFFEIIADETSLGKHQFVDIYNDIRNSISNKDPHKEQGDGCTFCPVINCEFSNAAKRKKEETLLKEINISTSGQTTKITMDVEKATVYHAKHKKQTLKQLCVEMNILMEKITLNKEISDKLTTKKKVITSLLHKHKNDSDEYDEGAKLLFDTNGFVYTTRLKYMGWRENITEQEILQVVDNPQYAMPKGGDYDICKRRGMLRTESISFFQKKRNFKN